MWGRFHGIVVPCADVSGVEEVLFSLLRSDVLLASELFENGLFFACRFPRSVCFSSPDVAAQFVACLPVRAGSLVADGYSLTCASSKMHLE